MRVAARRITSSINLNLNLNLNLLGPLPRQARRYTHVKVTPSILPSPADQTYNESHPQVDDHQPLQQLQQQRQREILSTMPVNAADFPELQACLTSNAEWAARTHADEPGFFERSAKGQKPFLLWIGCESSGRRSWS